MLSKKDLKEKHYSLHYGVKMCLDICPWRHYLFLSFPQALLSENCSFLTTGVLTIYKNHPDGNFGHKHKTIKCEIVGEGITIKYNYPDQLERVQRAEK